MPRLHRVFLAETAFLPQAHRRDHRSHLRFRIRLESHTVVAVSVEVREHGVVADSRQIQVRIGRGGSSLFHTTPQNQLLRKPRTGLVLASRIGVVRSRIAVVCLVARHRILERGLPPFPDAFRQQRAKQARCFLGIQEVSNPSWSTSFITTALALRLSPATGRAIRSAVPAGRPFSSRCLA